MNASGGPLLTGLRLSLLPGQQGVLLHIDMDQGCGPARSQAAACQSRGTSAI